MRNLLRTSLTLLVLLIVAASPEPQAAESGSVLPVDEIIRVLRTNNMVGLDEQRLNAAALEGLLRDLHPRVRLIGEPATASVTAGAEQPLIAAARVIEDRVGYLRLGRIGSGLAEAFDRAWSEQSASQRLTGLILDLRFAEGGDYAAAVALADRFVGDERPLLDWGKGMARSTGKFVFRTLPVVVLANGETGQAAEALIGMLRLVDAAVVVGQRTAGRAYRVVSVSLSDGRRLEFAGEEVKMGDDRTLPVEGLEPDVPVAATLSAEKVWLADPYQVIEAAPAAGREGDLSLRARSRLSQAARRPGRPFNEAELVRQHRNGEAPAEDEAGLAGSSQAVEARIIRDPSLARAVDLVKGLAMLERARHP